MQADRGVTLVECLLTIVIGAILFAVGVPTFANLVQNARLQTALAQLHLGLETARSHAIKTRHNVVMCKSATGSRCDTDGGWDQGWMVFVDQDNDKNCIDLDLDRRCDGDGGAIILIDGPTSNHLLSLRGNNNIRNRVIFNSRGSAAGYPGTFSACDGRGITKARGLVLSIVGRVRPAIAGDNVSCSENDN